MIFHPQGLMKTEGCFILPPNAVASAHACLDKEVIGEFWHQFSFRTSELSVSVCDEYVFMLGKADRLSLDGAEYSISIEPDGICVCAENEKNLLRGFMTLIDRFRAADMGDTVAAEAECCRIRDGALIPSRMVHFCIFPETELWEVQRFVRLCGALKYTHVILEFWGTLRYDCMRELAWERSFSKDQIRPIVREANDLGLEVIPMFNHWGHAAASRVMHGKHVVLDQNPSLQNYFSEDGWCWDVGKPKVRALLREIREELIGLCGEGGYFHIGCDEAYRYDFTKENMDFICDFINEIAEEMALRRRRVIAWGDMFLYRHPYYNAQNYYACNAPTSKAERYMLERLDRKVIVADWQYNCKQAPVETVSVFRNAGFDCLACPWDRGIAQMRAVLETAKSYASEGFIHTTWHTLSSGMPYVVLAAVAGFEQIGDYADAYSPTITASLLRKVMPAEGNYERAGWCKFEIHGLW